MRTPPLSLGHGLRLFCVALTLTLLVPAGSGQVFGVAHAQEVGERRSGGGILRFLFSRGEREPQRRDRVVAPPAETQRRAPPATRRSQPAPAAPVVPAIEKAEDASRVLVVGDFLGGGLADGLASAYEQNADVVIVNRTNGSSGLVRDDYYDWPGSISTLIDEEKPDAVVVMIGSNDRQQMRVDGNREQPRSEAWLKEYERRATALIKAVRDKDLPLIWVGNLPFRPGAMSSDMLAFNDIYRRLVTDAGGEYVDVWDGFVDESGAFATNGPDMNGQPAQLRSSDGINVTRDGRRKIAFYAEKPLNRLFETGSATPGTPGLDGGGLLGGPSPDGDTPAVIDRTAPTALDDLGADSNSQLLGASFSRPAAEGRTPAQRLSREGIAPAATPGRADDFEIRRPGAAAGEPDRQSTTAITP
ncbi:MAG: DUF459 domain-containing protein [Aquamicrobium sp.]|nr:DUF459 domain-containing protein [Aquamicrobium sp.]